jgi:hypothetical protein
VTTTEGRSKTIISTKISLSIMKETKMKRVKMDSLSMRITMKMMEMEVSR